jgi:hypothetical protein
LQCNAKDTLPIESGSYLDRFYEATKSMTAHDIAVYLEGDEEIEVRLLPQRSLCK